MDTTMEDIFTNIFENINKVSISRGTFIKWGNRVDIPGKEDFIEQITKTTDSVHDELGHEENNPKPKDWEDEMILFTKLYDLPIYKQLSIYGKCFVVEKDRGDDGGIPWRIPNNNETCYVKDCFAGSCVPGLNNLLDQSAASMQSFLDITGEPKLVNPLNGGGLGQQLLARQSVENNINYLPYTAYFNYDVLMFKFIIATTQYEFNETDALISLAGKLANYQQSDNLTAIEIQIINTVNLNYIWAFLMCFCYKSVDSDKYLNVQGNREHKRKYINMLRKLTHIRFDGFMLNKDGFISNPFFYNRRGTAYYVLDENTASYIDAMTTKIYEIMECVVIDSTVGQQPLTVTVSGSQYITSQSIAASCNTSIIGKNKSVICRNSKAKDPISNACMNELNTLFQDKDSKAHGWNILKFSGDSSHVVFGYIMEKIFAHFPNTKQIKIVYLISERPLAARLLSDAKTVFMSGTKVFNENFSGRGMENKTDIHAAYYIECDPSQSIISTIENFIAKVFENKTSEISTNFLGNLQNVNNKKNLKNKMYKLILPEGVVRGAINTEQAKEAAKNLLLLLETEPYNTFLKNYEILKLREKYERLVGESNNFTELGKKLISEILILRLTSKTNWSWLVNGLKTTPIAPDDINGIEQFKKFSEIMSIFQSLKEKGEIDYVKTQHYDLLRNAGYKVVYDKITTVYIKSGPKYINFKEDRTNDYLLTTKGVGDKIPNQVELIFQSLISFIDTVLDVHESFRTQLGGGDVPIIQFVYSENNPHPETLNQMEPKEYNKLSEEQLKSFNTKQLLALYENTKIKEKVNIIIEGNDNIYSYMYEILIDDTVNALKTVIISGDGYVQRGIIHSFKKILGYDNNNDNNDDTIQIITKDLMDYYLENVVPLIEFNERQSVGQEEEEEEEVQEKEEMKQNFEKFISEYNEYRGMNLDAYDIIYSRIDLLCGDEEAESEAESEAKIQQNINFINAAFIAMNFKVPINNTDLKYALIDRFKEEFPSEKITKLENVQKLKKALIEREGVKQQLLNSFDAVRLGTTPEMLAANIENFKRVQDIDINELERMRGNISQASRIKIVAIIKLIINFKKKYNHAYTISPLVEEYINSPPLRRGEKCTSILDCFIKNSGIDFGIRGGKQATRKRRPYKSKNIRKHRKKTKTKKAKKRKTIKKKAKY